MGVNLAGLSGMASSLAVESDVEFVVMWLQQCHKPPMTGVIGGMYGD